MRRFALWFGWVCMGLVGAGTWAPLAWGQTGGDRLTVMKPDSNTVFRPTGVENGEFTAFKDGKKTVTEADRPFLQLMAKWYVYRLTWQEYQVKKIDATPTLTMNDICQEAFRQIHVPDPRKPLNEGQKAYMVEFTQALLPPIEEVLKHPAYIARISAGRILAKLGEAGQDAAGDLMVKTLEDKDQIDAVKFWALHGLHDLFAAVHVTPPKREEQCIKALLNFLTSKPKISANASTEEINGFRYMRREAIRALGQTRYPALIVNKDMEGRTALELLNVVTKSGVNPEPSLSEQQEAVQAICQLQSRLTSSYQPDIAAYQIGLYILDFVDRFEQDRKEETKGKSEPWKGNAARLNFALDGLGKDVAGNQNLQDAAKAFVAGLVSQAKGVLTQVENGQAATNRQAFDTFLTRNPREGQLYKGDDKSLIKLPEKSEK